MLVKSISELNKIVKIEILTILIILNTLCQYGNFGICVSILKLN